MKVGIGKRCIKDLVQRLVFYMYGYRNTVVVGGIEIKIDRGCFFKSGQKLGEVCAVEIHAEAGMPIFLGGRDRAREKGDDQRQADRYEIIW